MDRIGKYDIVDKIGQGGMGTVYRARDSVIGRDVAIKVIHDVALGSPDSKERFYREARSAGRLSHENITTIYDVGEDDGRPFIVMEFLEGDDLRTLMDRPESQTPEKKLDVAIQICQGLHYAHRHNVIHRDIKPDNIRVLPNGRVKILDFGIARIQGDEQVQTITLTGMSVGTPRYMSPEQIRGDKLDARSDIFAFGVLFYEMLSGEPPFAGERVTTIIYKILNVDPERAEFDPKAISDDLHPVLFRCLAKKKEDRYSDFAELLQDLQTIFTSIDQSDETLDTRELNASITSFLERDSATVVSEDFSSESALESGALGPLARPKMSPARLGIWLGSVATVVVLIVMAVFMLKDPVDSVPASAVTSADPQVAAESANGEISSESAAGGIQQEESSSTDGGEGTGTQAAVRAAAENRSLGNAAVAPDNPTAESAGANRPSEEVSTPAVDPRQPATEIVDESRDTPAARASDAEAVNAGANASETVPAPNNNPESDLDNDLDNDAPDAALSEQERARMIVSKQAVPFDMSGHQSVTNANGLEEQGNRAFAEQNFDAAAGFFVDAAAAYEEAVALRDRLDGTLHALVQRLDALLGAKDVDGLRDVHAFYASDYYETLFNIAVEITAASDFVISDISARTATTDVTTRFVYTNNKNESIGFDRTEQWTLVESNGAWTLISVDSL